MKHACVLGYGQVIERSGREYYIEYKIIF